MFQKVLYNDIICKKHISALFLILRNLYFKERNDAGLIAGLIVGVLVCIGIAAALIILVMRRRIHIRKDKVNVLIYEMHESFEMLFICYPEIIML